jgi:hypothetical protein
MLENAGILIPLVAITFGCLLAAFIVVVNLIAKLKAQSVAMKGNVAKEVKDLEDRLDHLEGRYEERIANLETLVLDQEKEKRFDEAL